MWYRVGLSDRAATMQRQGEPPFRSLEPFHTAAVDEAGLVLLVMLTLATIAEFVARTPNLS